MSQEQMFAPRDPPWLLFYRRGLKEFLAACGVHEPSANADASENVIMVFKVLQVRACRFEPRRFN